MCCISNESPDDTAGAVTLHQGLHLCCGYKIKITLYGMLQAGGGHRKIKRFLVVTRVSE